MPVQALYGISTKGFPDSGIAPILPRYYSSADDWLREFWL